MTSTGLFLLPLLAATTYLLFLFFLRTPDSFPSLASNAATAATHHDSCKSRYIYVHRLPPRFNSDILLDCRRLNPRTDMCPFLANGGFGRPIRDRKFLQGDTWHDTHQFSLDVIFHERIKSYDCLTDDSNLASAVFVPFYAGLDMRRYLRGSESNTSIRDSSGVELAAWLRSTHEWLAMGGRDHFMVAGRVTWDFRRPLPDDPSAWGNRLLLLPEIRNMTTLVLETRPRAYAAAADDHHPDVAVPYPTYFHPRSRNDVAVWQEHVRRVRRRWLFSFVGAPRVGGTPTRAAAIEQCHASSRCKRLDCGGGAGGLCRSPVEVMRVLGSSVFCLQPPGDTLTRKSTFDSMVAGCIPVFFTNGSAAKQYTWHLGGAVHSVVIGETDWWRVEKVLLKVSEEEVRRMREEVVRMIPKLVYRDPKWVGEEEEEGVTDAFDVALDGVLRRIERRRKEMGERRGLGRSKLHFWVT